MYGRRLVIAIVLLGACALAWNGTAANTGLTYQRQFEFNGASADTMLGPDSGPPAAATTNMSADLKQTPPEPGPARKRTSAVCTEGWLPGGDFAVLDGPVYAMTIWDPDGSGPLPPLLVVGGSFTYAGTTQVNNIAAWDGTSWHALGSGTSGEVGALADYDGFLVVGGDFATAGGSTANNLAYTDGTNWWGIGTTGYVYALLAYQGDLIVGGSFDHVGGVAAHNIARTHSYGQFQTLGTAVVQGPVHALAEYNGDLIAGGDFYWIGTLAVRCVARWDGLGWHALGQGVDCYTSYGICTPWVQALVQYGDNLYVGGYFTDAVNDGSHTVDAYYSFAQWDGAAWDQLGGGVVGGQTPEVSALAVCQGKLSVGGSFTAIGGGAGSANNIGRFSGPLWAGPLGSGVQGGQYPSVQALMMYNGDLIVGGRFNVAGGASSPNLARYYACPIGACCVQSSCTITTEPNCPGTWTEGGSCTPNPCSLALGSCCVSGNCTVTAEADCGGTWTEGGSCNPNSCPQPPQNACCTSNGCSMTTQAACTGFWIDAPRCESDTCLWAKGACCVNGNCIPNLAQAFCHGEGGVAYPGQATCGSCTPIGASGSCCVNGNCTVTPAVNCTGAWTNGGTCNPNPCPPPPTGACCVGGACSVTTQANCSGTWTQGGSCSPNPCPQPTGACCVDGACSVTTQANCSGTWASGALCDPNPCPQPTGSCCVDGVCSVTTQAECSGTWTSGGACSPNPCPPPQGACCQSGGACSVATQTDCTGTWRGAGTTCSPDAPCDSTQSEQNQPAGGLCPLAFILMSAATLIGLVRTRRDRQP